MININKRILDKILKQFRLESHKTIVQRGCDVEIIVSDKLWEVSFDQVDNRITSQVISQIKNKLYYAKYL
jgi:hypothetical protein